MKHKQDEQCRWEPWKALSTAFGAGIAVASALIGAGIALGNYMHH